MTWTELLGGVSWPKVAVACLLSRLGHHLSLKAIEVLEAPCKFVLPDAFVPWLLLGLFLTLLIATSLGVGRWIAIAVPQEQPRHYTVLGFILVSVVYSMLFVSQHPLVMGWLLLNVLITLIGAGLSHKIQWLRLPQVVSRIFSVPNHPPKSP